VPETCDTVSHTLRVRRSHKYSVLVKSYSEIELGLSPSPGLAGLESYVRLQVSVLLSAFPAADTHGLLLFAMYSSSNPTAASASEPLTSDLLFTVACPLFHLLHSSPIKRLKQLVTDYLELCLDQSQIGLSSG
jgi:hypothetical protein